MPDTFTMRKDLTLFKLLQIEADKQGRSLAGLIKFICWEYIRNLKNV